MTRIPTALAWLALLLAVAIPAHALTTPLAGAVAWPNTTPLRLPFPAGHAIAVTSGYGPAMGSSLHDGLNNASSSNDHYALDLTYANEPNNGMGLPVVAAISGTVVAAGWATAGWANYGQRVMLQHDIGDGHSYLTLYAHLDSIDPAVQFGAPIAQGQVIGALGDSCQGDIMQLDCPFFAPHLHFALHRDSSVGGSGTGGSYGGNAVVPEPLSGAEDIVQGMTIVSDNDGGAVVGCPAIGPEGAIIDESDALCFSPGGTPAYWTIESAGHLDSLRWTTATDAAVVDNHGAWRFDFEQAGFYAIDVYTDAAHAQSTAAAYQVTHAGTTEVVVIDQSAADGWRPLGSFDFDAGPDQGVRLDDVTGEPLSLMRKLVFDAIRITPLNEGGANPDGGAGGAGSTSGGGEGGSATGSGGADRGGDAGCGCRLGPRDGGAGWWLLALCLGFTRARRPTGRGRSSRGRRLR